MIRLLLFVCCLLACPAAAQQVTGLRMQGNRGTHTLVYTLDIEWDGNNRVTQMEGRLTDTDTSGEEEPTLRTTSISFDYSDESTVKVTYQDPDGDSDTYRAELQGGCIVSEVLGSGWDSEALTFSYGTDGRIANIGMDGYSIGVTRDAAGRMTTYSTLGFEVPVNMGYADKAYSKASRRLFSVPVNVLNAWDMDYAGNALRLGLCLMGLYGEPEPYPIVYSMDDGDDGEDAVEYRAELTAEGETITGFTLHTNDTSYPQVTEVTISWGSTLAGVQAAQQEAAVSPGVYSLNGQRRQSLARGLNIVKTKDGRVIKVQK